MRVQSLFHKTLPSSILSHLFATKNGFLFLLYKVRFVLCVLIKTPKPDERQLINSSNHNASPISIYLWLLLASISLRYSENTGSIFSRFASFFFCI